SPTANPSLGTTTSRRTAAVVGTDAALETTTVAPARTQTRPATASRRTVDPATLELPLIGTGRPVLAPLPAHGSLTAHAAATDEISLFQDALTSQETMLGEQDPATIAARGRLAAAYWAVGQLDRAIPLYEQTVADCEAVLGAHDRYTFSARNSLAAAYELDGRLADAISLYERTLADAERSFGPNHPDTAAARANLAVASSVEARLDRVRPTRPLRIERPPLAAAS
ncbi:MAG TPA: tetratricopeptide repeat protein, partial [Micromonosporaceae bacterium]